MDISISGAGFVPYGHISSNTIPEGTGGKMSHNFTGHGQYRLNRPQPHNPTTRIQFIGQLFSPAPDNNAEFNRD
jgi:hypothetical protein